MTRKENLHVVKPTTSVDEALEPLVHLGGSQHPMTSPPPLEAQLALGLDSYWSRKEPTASWIPWEETSSQLVTLVVAVA